MRSDAEKLRKLAEYFDRLDANSKSALAYGLMEDTEVQDDLRRIARELESTGVDAVYMFHSKMGVPMPMGPEFLDAETLRFRLNFLKEEVGEIEQQIEDHELLLAAEAGANKIYGEHPDFPRIRANQLALIFDGLIDLSYVTYGFALMLGLPWKRGFMRVHAANMRKELAPSKAASLASTGRGHKFDVIKPPGWQPPVLLDLVR